MAAEGGRGPSFPVVLFDGEREMSIGDVKINSRFEHRTFQKMLSRRIGVSPNQISICLVDRNSENRRRIPVTGRVNYEMILSQRDSCFLVSLKNSRKSRNRRERMFEFADFLSEGEFSPPPSSVPNRKAPKNFKTPAVGSVSDRLPVAGDGRRKSFCGECEDAARNESKASFHPCVNDAVISDWFTARVGPINRPCRSTCS